MIRGLNTKDITWLSADGFEMSDEVWNSSVVWCLGVRLAGDAIMEVDEYGELIKEDTILLLMNAGADNIPFMLPDAGPKFIWELFLDTFSTENKLERLNGGSEYQMKNHTFAVFMLVEKPLRKE